MVSQMLKKKCPRIFLRELLAASLCRSGHTAESIRAGGWAGLQRPGLRGSWLFDRLTVPQFRQKANHLPQPFHRTAVDLGPWTAASPVATNTEKRFETMEQQHENLEPGQLHHMYLSCVYAYLRNLLFGVRCRFLWHCTVRPQLNLNLRPLRLKSSRRNTFLFFKDPNVVWLQDGGHLSISLSCTMTIKIIHSFIHLDFMSTQVAKETQIFFTPEPDNIHRQMNPLNTILTEGKFVDMVQPACTGEKQAINKVQAHITT